MQKDAPHEKTKFWRDADTGGLELLHATYITHTFVPHIHEGFAIGVIERGAETFTYRRASHIAPAGSLVVINPGEVHTGEAASRQGWIYRMIYPSVELLQRAASEVAGQQRDIPFFPAPVIYNDELAALFANLHRAFEQGDTLLERESRLLWVLAKLIVQHADNRPAFRAAPAEHNSVRKVRGYLEEHYAEPIRLEDLASHVSLSPFHLLRVFRQEVGLPPHAYLTQLRVRQARRLLAAGVPIAEVAARTGFTDQSHLTRHFKRTVGVPPGHYQQNSKNVQDNQRD